MYEKKIIQCNVHLETKENNAGRDQKNIFFCNCIFYKGTYIRSAQII